jgi:GNAT superfamily N-acetyltransferase
MTIAYAVERVGAEEAFDLLTRSGYFEGITLKVDAADVGQAFDGSNLVVTARHDGLLVGVVRALTDFSRHCFVASVAVDPNCQGQGVGRQLISRTHEAAGGAHRIVLFVHSAPWATVFYEKLGMVREPNSFSLNNVD